MTYNDWLAETYEETEWIHSIHRLEAELEASFAQVADELVDLPDYCTPYGASFGLVDMKAVR